MNYHEAKKRFTGKFFRYSHFYEDDEFVEINLNLCDLPQHRIKFTTDYYVDRIKRNLGFPPVWIMTGYKLRTGEVQPFHYGMLIMDGNHRIGASRECGLYQIPVIMARSHLEIFRRMNNDNLDREA